MTALTPPGGPIFLSLLGCYYSFDLSEIKRGGGGAGKKKKKDLDTPPGTVQHYSIYFMVASNMLTISFKCEAKKNQIAK